MQNLFVYGTLEIPQVMNKLLGRVPVAESAVLRDYARYMLRKQPYPGIIKQEGAEVEGVLYRGISAKYLQILDRYEGRFYQRRIVHVKNARGYAARAWTYIVPLRYKNALSDVPWDRTQFIQEHLKRFLCVR